MYESWVHVCVFHTQIGSFIELRQEHDLLIFRYHKVWTAIIITTFKGSQKSFLRRFTMTSILLQHIDTTESRSFIVTWINEMITLNKIKLIYLIIYGIVTLTYFTII